MRVELKELKDFFRVERVRSKRSNRKYKKSIKLYFSPKSIFLELYFFVLFFKKYKKVQYNFFKCTKKLLFFTFFKKYKKVQIFSKKVYKIIKDTIKFFIF